MAVLVLLKQKFTIFTLVSILFCSYTGYAPEVPGQMVGNALLCFNDKVSYTGCAEEHRLTQSGILNVPPEATDLFCNGPCLSETQGVLSCIDNILSNFLFYNGATVGDIRNALDAGCSYTSQRGDFNVARYMEGDTSAANRSLQLIKFYDFALMVGLCFLIVL